MRFTASIVTIYGLFVLMGGLIGYLTADSLPSLISGAIFGALLFASGLGIYRSSVLAFFTAMGLSLILALFFSFRFYHSLKLMPAGMMAIFSFLVFLLILTTRGKPKKKQSV